MINGVDCQTSFHLIAFEQISTCIIITHFKSLSPFSSVLKLTILGPMYGDIVYTDNGEKVEIFSLKELQAGLIMYHNYRNHSETLDLIRLQISDGYHQFSAILKIKIQSEVITLSLNYL